MDISTPFKEFYIEFLFSNIPICFFFVSAGEINGSVLFKDSQTLPPPPPLPGKVTAWNKSDQLSQLRKSDRSDQNFFIGLSYVKFNSEQKRSHVYPCQKLIVFEIFSVLCEKYPPARSDHALCD